MTTPPPSSASPDVPAVPSDSTAKPTIASAIARQDPSAFEEWARRVSSIAAGRRGRREVPAIISRLAALHDELAALHAAPAPTATVEELAVLGEATATLHGHLVRLVSELDRTPEWEPSRLTRIPLRWGDDPVSALTVAEEWGSAGPAQFPHAPLSARSDALDGVGVRGTLFVPAVGPAGACRTTRWRLAVDSASAPAVVEAQGELAARGTRAARIHAEIGRWLPVVASQPSLLSQYQEGALHRRDAIAEVERWFWTRDGARWVTHTAFREAQLPRQLFDKTVGYHPTTTVAPEAYRVLEELREHLARWPLEVGGVASTNTSLPGYGRREEFRTERGGAGTTVIFSAIVHVQLGELAFKWLVDLVPPRRPITGRPTERPEIVLVQQDGATARVVTNIPRLLVRVVDADGPEGTENGWVTLPGDGHPVHIARREPEVDPAFVDLIRAHAPRRRRGNAKGPEAHMEGR